MALSQAEYGQITRLCHKANMVIYTLPAEKTGKPILRGLACQLGLDRLDPNMLADEDGITRLTVVETKSQRGYIPYSNRRLLWHTDGYYNPPERTIRAMLLHCARSASQGGENALIDHEMVYLLMRDEDPEMVHALMDPKAMAIPANTEGGHTRRTRQEGPVFSIDPLSGHIHMRYTARSRSIEWQDNPATHRATQWLTQFFSSDSPYKFQVHLKPGQGILCNNVLHNRAAFDDDNEGGKGRLVYRGRFYDRIKDDCTGKLGPSLHSRYGISQHAQPK